MPLCGYTKSPEEDGGYCYPDFGLRASFSLLLSLNSYCCRTLGATANEVNSVIATFR